MSTMKRLLPTILTVAVAALAFYYLIESPFHRLAIASSNRVLGRTA